jgi:hypothetical protein
MILGIDDGGLFQVLEAILVGLSIYYLRVSYKGDVTEFFTDDGICSHDSSFLITLRKHDALAILTGVLPYFFN